jgi:hypothetical protein
MSVFSALNNLEDISLDKRYSQLLGITQQELETNFTAHINHYCQEQDATRHHLLTKVKNWYDGYSFDGKHFVYNPFSLLNFFKKQDWRNYWMESGSPSFLLEYVKRHQVKPEQLRQIQVQASFFAKYEMEDAPPASLFYQAGYLTLVDQIGRGYKLDFPNLEVESSFNDLVLDAIYQPEPMQKEAALIGLEQSLVQQDVEQFVANLNQLIASIPYDLISAQESYYHTVILMALKAAGLKVKAEEHTRQGRSDLVVTLAGTQAPSSNAHSGDTSSSINPNKSNTIWLIELKKDQSAQVALEQIQDKQYYQKYLQGQAVQGSRRPGKQPEKQPNKQPGKQQIYLIGLNIDTKQRQIADWEAEVVGGESAQNCSKLK